MPQKDPCQRQACELQKCLQANSYVESKCQAVLRELRQCCARLPKGRSLVCSGFEREEDEEKRAPKPLHTEAPRAPGGLHLPSSPQPRSRRHPARKATLEAGGAALSAEQAESI